MSNPVSEFRGGWRIILGAAIGVGFGLSGLPFYTLGVFLKPLSAEFGWSRAQVSGAALCVTVGLVLTSPIVGRLADRIDVRRIGLVSLAGLAAGLVGVSQVTSDIRIFYLALLALSLAACGTTPIVWTRAVTAWFDRGRGLALALTLVGTGLAAILGPLCASALIQNHGWRVAYIGLAISVVVIAIPLVAILLRPAGNDRSAASAASFGATSGEAIRSRAFWLIAVAFFLVSTGISGAIVHLVPLLTDAGLAPGLAARVAGLMGAAIIIGRLIVGALVDRYPAKYVAGIFILVPISGCLMLAGAEGSVPIAVAAALTFGLSAGAEVDLIAFLTSRYFGLRSYGQIYSWQWIAFSLGSGIGPLAAGAAHDAFGTYRPALYAAALMFALAAILLLGLGTYRYPNAGARVFQEI